MRAHVPSIGVFGVPVAVPGPDVAAMACVVPQLQDPAS